MNYKIDNTPLSSFGAIPSPSSSHFALSGMLDLPNRLGITEYNWGTSIEPFVDEEDIELNGRTLTLSVAIKKTNLDAFKSACVSCKELSFDYDTFRVIQKDEIKVEEIRDYCKVSVPFWQNEVELKTVDIIPSGHGIAMIDNYNLARDLNMYIGKSIDILNASNRINIETTEFYTKTQYRGGWNIELQCSITGHSFEDIYHKINQLQAILMLPGMRSLYIRNNYFDVYFKDGMTVQTPTEKIAKFILKARAIRLRDIHYLLASEDDLFIITEDGYCIDLKHY